MVQSRLPEESEPETWLKVIREKYECHPENVGTLCLIATFVNMFFERF